MPLVAIENAPNAWQDHLAYNCSGAFASLCGLQDASPGQGPGDSTAMAITNSILGASTNIASAILQAKALKYQAQAERDQWALAQRHRQQGGGGGGFDFANPAVALVGVGVLAVIGYAIFKKKKAG